MADDKKTPDSPAAQEDQTLLTEVVGLLRDHPRWAVWLPAGGRVWTAVRPAGSRVPGPEVPLLWVHAGTVSELGRLMRDVDQEISGGFTGLRPGR
jgi:hypothetical protein